MLMLTLYGQENDYQLKRNGNGQPEVDYRIKSTLGETKDPIVKELNTMIKSVSQAESGAIRLTGMVYMTCQVMFGSGARIGLTQGRIVNRYEEDLGR